MGCCLFTFALVALSSLHGGVVRAFQSAFHRHVPLLNDAGTTGTTRQTWTSCLPAAASDEDAVDNVSTTAGTIEMDASLRRETPRLEPDDISFVQSLYNSCNGSAEAMETELAANLGNMHPRLVVALQMAADELEWKQQEATDESFESQMIKVGTSLQSILNNQLKSGRELLEKLLNSGELRKLDSMISKAAKDGQLDMSFFSVLSMNMRDAAAAGGSVSPTLAQGEGQPEVTGEDGQPQVGANRSSILQHIYTRCQEELEKNVAPGMGLLNKLLRTEISSIRTNQLNHYLGPQRTSITSPEGKTIELPGTDKPLVSHGEFTDALESTVSQIRTLEASGGTDKLSATNLVESIRQIAIEARGVLVASYGEDSVIVDEFQKDLQPVFRPGR